MSPVEPCQVARAAESYDRETARRTGTDQDVQRITRPDLFEHRLDFSAAAQYREQALDSVRDDAGPQSDQC